LDDEMMEIPKIPFTPVKKMCERDERKFHHNKLRTRMIRPEGRVSGECERMAGQ
jgi:hypothetical protein